MSQPVQMSVHKYLNIRPAVLFYWRIEKTLMPLSLLTKTRKKSLKRLFKARADGFSKFFFKERKRVLPKLYYSVRGKKLFVVYFTADVFFFFPSLPTMSKDVCSSLI